MNTLSPNLRWLRWLEYASILAILLAFSALCWHQIELPGLHPDEAQEVIPVIQILNNAPFDTIRNHGIEVLGARFPLMIQDYIGTVNTYLYVPFIGIFGVSVYSLRLMSILISVVTLLLVWRIGRAWVSPLAGVLAALFLAMQPSFIFWSRQSVYVTFVTVPLTLGAMLCGWYWWRKKTSVRWLYAGAFLLGLGIAAKMLVGWVLIGIGGAFGLLYLLPNARKILEARSLKPIGITLTLRQFVFAGVCLCAGLFMLIIYNLQTGGTFALLNDFGGTSYYGVDNSAFLENLAARIENLRVTITGEQFWYLTGGALYGNPLWSQALLITPLLALIIVFWRGRTDWRRSVFLLIALTLMLLSSVFTVSALWATHMAILMPFPPLLLAISLALIIRHFPGNRFSYEGAIYHAPTIKIFKIISVQLLRWLIICIFVTVLVYQDVQATLAYHHDLTRMGGFGGHSSAIDTLMDTLESLDPLPPLYAVDWGIQNQIRFLSGGTMQPIDIAGFELNPDPGFAVRVQQSLTTPNSLYLFHAPGDTTFQRRDAFEQIIAESGFTISSDEVVYDRTGRPIFHLVRLEPTP